MPTVEQVANQIWYGPRKLHHWLLFLVLLPLSFLFMVITASRRYLYALGLFSSSDLSVPIVVIGNISVGGTGKTPLTIALACALKEAGLTVGVVSRGYGGKSDPDSYPLVVNETHSASECGDEPLMIWRNAGVSVTVDPVRSRGAKHLIESAGCNVVICDDGLQHYALGRQLEVAVIDGERRFGNGMLLPAGPLREPRSRLHSCKYAVINGGNAQIHLDDLIGNLGVTEVFRMTLEQKCLVNLKTGESRLLSDFQGDRVHLVAGIGNPERFFAGIERQGVRAVRHPYPDHYLLLETDLKFGDSLAVIMTEKDAVKLPDTTLDNLWYLPIAARLPEAFVKKLLVDIKLLIK